MRICKDCKIKKPIREFERCFTHTWYTKRRCRNCEAARLLSFREANRKKLAQKTKRYRIENPEKYALSMKRSKAKDPEKQKRIQKESDRRRRDAAPYKLQARRKTKQLIKKGDLLRLPCKYCGDAKTQAHHPDYNDPLLVEWLCHKHHKAWHRVFLTEDAE